MVIFTTKYSDTYKNDKEFDHVFVEVEKFADMVLMQVNDGDSLTIQDFMYKFHCNIDTTLEVLGYLYHKGNVNQYKGTNYIFVKEV